MSISVTSDLWKHVSYKGGQLVTILAMGDWASDDGSRIFPSIKTLAAKARISERAVQLNLRCFERDGVITCVKRATGRPGAASEYRINMDVVRMLHPDMDPKSIQERVKKMRPSTGEASALTGEDEDDDGCSPRPETGEIHTAYNDIRQDEPLNIRPRSAEARTLQARIVRLAKRLGEKNYRAWFAEVCFEEGPPVAIVFERVYQAKWVRERYATIVEDAFGDDVKIIAKSERKGLPTVVAGGGRHFSDRPATN